MFQKIMLVKVQTACYMYDHQDNVFSKYGALSLKREKFAIVPFTQDGASGQFSNQQNNNFVNFSVEYFAIGGSNGVEAIAFVEVASNGSDWKMHCGSLFNPITAGATVALIV